MNNQPGTVGQLRFFKKAEHRVCMTVSEESNIKNRQCGTEFVFPLQSTVLWTKHFPWTLFFKKKKRKSVLQALIHSVQTVTFSFISQNGDNACTECDLTWYRVSFLFGNMQKKHFREINSSGSTLSSWLCGWCCESGEPSEAVDNTGLWTWLTWGGFVFL